MDLVHRRLLITKQALVNRLLITCRSPRGPQCRPTCRDMLTIRSFKPLSVRSLLIRDTHKDRGVVLKGGSHRHTDTQTHADTHTHTRRHTQTHAETESLISLHPDPAMLRSVFSLQKMSRVELCLAGDHMAAACFQHQGPPRVMMRYKGHVFKAF